MCSSDLSGGNLSLSGLTTTAKAIYSVLLWQMTERPLAIVVDGNKRAEELFEAVETFYTLLIASREAAGPQLQSIVTQTSRLILTGQAQDQGLSQAAFAQQLCSHVAVLFTCSNIMIDVQVCSSFCTANTGAPTLTYNGSGQVTNTWQYNPGSPGQIVVIRAMYQWPVFLGPLGFNLSNLSNGDRLIMATATFKNEPYQ